VIKKILEANGLSTIDWSLKTASRRVVISYCGHEIVISNNCFGRETVYLNGSMVSEKSNFFATKSSHFIVIENEDYEVRLWMTITMHVSLYKGLTEVASACPKQSKKLTWLWFLIGMFVGGAISGYLFGRLFWPAFAGVAG